MHFLQTPGELTRCRITIFFPRVNQEHHKAILNHRLLLILPYTVLNCFTKKLSNLMKFCIVYAFFFSNFQTPGELTRRRTTSFLSESGAPQSSIKSSTPTAKSPGMSIFRLVAATRAWHRYGTLIWTKLQILVSSERRYGRALDHLVQSR